MNNSVTQTRKFLFQKLVRDNIPEQIESSGAYYTWHILDDVTYKLELMKKLYEEMYEIEQASSKKEVADEIADIVELISALSDAYGISSEEISAIQEKKSRARGSFFHKQYIEHVMCDVSNKRIDYYLKHSDRYPEIT